MAKIITISNPKGGTSKTSTAINLACALTTVNKRVLLIDLDPQRSASVALGYEEPKSSNIATVLLDNNDINTAILHYEKAKFDVITSSEDLTAYPSFVLDRNNDLHVLDRALTPVKDDYDYVVIDTPATTNSITTSSICASNYLIIPVSTDMFSIDSMEHLIDIYTSLKEKNQTKCVLLGVLRTLFDKDHEISKQISSILEESFNDLLFKTKISFSHKISESSSAAIPVLLYDRTSLGALEYLEFASEVLKKTRD